MGRYEMLHDRPQAVLMVEAWARTYLAKYSKRGEPELVELPELDKVRLFIRLPGGRRFEGRITLREEDVETFDPAWAEQQVEEFIKGLP